MKFMQLRQKKNSRVLAWLELIRLPYLFSVPGDFLAGAALAAVLSGSFPSLFRMMCGSIGVIFFCAFGMIYNDVCDQSEDYFRKPGRPIPSRRIESGTALAAGAACLAAGVVLFLFCGRRTFLTGLVLVVLIVAYDSFLKKRLESGIVARGLFRGLAFLSGCGIVGWHFGCLPVFLAGTVYTALLTWTADGEERHQIPEKTVFYPAGIFAAGWILVFPFLMFAENLSSRMLGYSMVSLLIACSIVIYAAVQIYNRSVTSGEMRKYITWLNLAIMPWQASWIFLAGVYKPVFISGLALCLLVLFPVMAKLTGHLSEKS